MEYQEIDRLLNAYLEGNLSLEEEKYLREFLLAENLPVEFRGFKEMFSYFAERTQETYPDFDLTAQLNTLVENEWQKENKTRFRKLLLLSGSAAAVLIIALTALFFLNKPAPVKDTFSDPKLAYMEAKRALLKVSLVMNRHNAKLKYLEKIDESFQKAGKLNKINEVLYTVKTQ
ncbi:MAG: phage holin family protein [Bacteroidetes bacterium]|nr:phage holin family protein [Bacteroidota bacterium]